MKLLPAATALLAIFATFASPAFAKENCDAGFKTHMGKMSIYIDKLSGNELADVVRKSLDAYNSCKAGDDFSPHGVWDKIIADQYKADVGVLIVHDPHGCGLSAEVYARPERAFAVVHHECAANMYSLAHEIGHLIGARHDEALDNDMRPFAYGHGFVFGKSWRTMMAYKDSCDGCPRVPVWSSPTVKVQGAAAGNAESDNARVIAEQAGRVAKFR